MAGQRVRPRVGVAADDAAHFVVDVRQATQQAADLRRLGLGQLQRARHAWFSPAARVPPGGRGGAAACVRPGRAMPSPTDACERAQRTCSLPRRPSGLLL